MHNLINRLAAQKEANKTDGDAEQKEWAASEGSVSEMAKTAPTAGAWYMRHRNRKTPKREQMRLAAEENHGECQARTWGGANLLFGNDDDDY